MTRTAALLVAALVAASVVATAAPAGAALVAPESGDSAVSAPVANPDRNETAADNGSNGSVAPGAMLSGVVGVQRAELNGTIEARTFGVRIAAAASNRSKAAVVADQVDDLRERLAELRERKRALRAARENGSIDAGRFRAEMAELAAEVATVKRLANRTASAADTLPADRLRERGVNVTAIRRLRSDAANLTGPEVARIARSIAGPSIGSPMAGGPPDDIGPPEGVPGAGNGSERGPPANASDGGGPPDDAPGNASSGAAAGNESAPSDGDGQDGSDRGSDAGGAGTSGSDGGSGERTETPDDSGSDGGSSGGNSGDANGGTSRGDGR